MSELLMLKTLNNDYVLRGVKAVEKYIETHHVNLVVLISDECVEVYDKQVLLIKINIVLGGR